jgi:hypothetical protein
MSVQLTVVQPKSRFESIVEKTAETISRGVVYKAGGAVVMKGVEKAGQACLDNPPIVVVGAIAAIGVKELAPHVT